MDSKMLCGILIAVCVVFAGCKTMHAVENEGEEAPYPLVKDEVARFQVAQVALRSQIELAKIKADRLEGSGLLRVRAAIRNKRSKGLWIDMRTVFMDESGFEKESTNWEAFFLEGRTVTTYEAVSLGVQVHDYVIQARDPKRFKDKGNRR